MILFQMFFSLVLLLVSHGFISGHLAADFRTVRQSRPLSTSNFDQIRITGAFDVLLSQLTSSEDIAEAKHSAAVEIDTTAEVQKQISVEIKEGHILTITAVGSLDVEENPRVFIRMINPINEYRVDGKGSSITDKNGLTNHVNDTFILFQDHQTSVNFKLDVKNLDATIFGDRPIQLRGEVKGKANYIISRNSQVDLLKLKSAIVHLAIYGDPTVKVTATDHIQVHSSEAAIIHYRLPEDKEPIIISPASKTKFIRI